MSQQRNNQQIFGMDVRTTSETQVVAFLVQRQINWARRHPIWASLWALGLFLTAFVNGVAVNPSSQEEFFDDIDRANGIFYNDVYTAAQREKAAYDIYYRSKGWFSCDDRCNANYDAYLRAQDALGQQQNKHADSLSNAKSKVGIFSQFGVQETRKIFWDAWASGLATAKRMSFWDLMFAGMRSRRDDTWIEVGLRLLMQVLMNITIGMTFALFGFLYSLAKLCWSYKAGIAGFAFFFLAGTAACSMMATFILGVWNAGTLVAFSVIKQSALAGGRDARQRYRNGGQGGQQQPGGYRRGIGQHEHWQ